VHDAEAVAKALSLQKGNELYKDVFITLLSSNQKEKNLKPTKGNIYKALDEIRKKATADDVVTIYYSGHGMSAPYKGSNLFYLVPEDFDWSQNVESSSIAKSEGVDAETLTDSLSKFKAHKVILLLDACHSGDVLLAARGEDKKEANTSGLQRLANGTGRFIFASSAGDEKSRETSKIGHGLFTYVLLNALGANPKTKYPSADIQQNGKSDKLITLNEINAYIAENFQSQIGKYLQSSVQTPIPMSGLGRYSSRSKIVDFPFVKVK
jgi:uncharacterized caspase-like protein